jgi:hypothetical protein
MNKKKNILLLLKHKIEWFLILLGLSMATFGLLSFSIRPKPMSDLEDMRHIVHHTSPNYYFYYYNQLDKILIVCGVIIVSLGILIYKEKRIK